MPNKCPFTIHEKYSRVLDLHVAALVTGDGATAAHVALLAAHSEPANDFLRAYVTEHTAGNTGIRDSLHWPDRPCYV